MNDLSEETEITNDDVLNQWRSRYENEPDFDLRQKYQFDYEIVKKQIFEDNIDYEDPEVVESVNRINEYLRKSAEESSKRMNESIERFHDLKEQHENRMQIISKLPHFIVLSFVAIGIIYIVVN